MFMMMVKKIVYKYKFCKLLREVLYISIFQIFQKSNHSNFGKDAQFFSIVIICLKDSVNKPWSRYYGDQKKYLQNYAPCCFDKGPIHEGGIQTLKNVPPLKKLVDSSQTQQTRVFNTKAISRYQIYPFSRLSMKKGIEPMSLPAKQVFFIVCASIF